MSVSTTFKSDDIAMSLLAAVDARDTRQEPFRWHLLADALPPAAIRELAELPFPAPALRGVSGKRELHNDTRSYFDKVAMARFPVMRAVAEALQTTKVARAIEAGFGARVDDTFLRLEYAQDIDGFWLEPHSDLGVKTFTCLIYLTEDHGDLGTDLYDQDKRHFGRSPFGPGLGMVFVPGDNTWHGFEKRPIKGVRKSVILNYVTHDWRAREQLSFPEQVVRT